MTQPLGLAATPTQALALAQLESLILTSECAVRQADSLHDQAVTQLRKAEKLLSDLQALRATMSPHRRAIDLYAPVAMGLKEASK